MNYKRSPQKGKAGATNTKRRTRVWVASAIGPNRKNTQIKFARNIAEGKKLREEKSGIEEEMDRHAIILNTPTGPRVIFSNQIQDRMRAFEAKAVAAGGEIDRSMSRHAVINALRYVRINELVRRKRIADLAAQTFQWEKMLEEENPSFGRDVIMGRVGKLKTTLQQELGPKYNQFVRHYQRSIRRIFRHLEKKI